MHEDPPTHNLDQLEEILEPWGNSWLFYSWSWKYIQEKTSLAGVWAAVLIASGREHRSISRGKLYKQIIIRQKNGSVQPTFLLCMCGKSDGFNYPDRDPIPLQ